MFKKVVIASLTIISMRCVSHGALSATMIWEVRALAGNDGNAGCFDQAASSGTDYTQQNAAQYSFSDLKVDASVNTKVTSANHVFVSSDVRNCLYITNGGGVATWTTGYYEIASVTASSATLDRSPAATSSTGGIWTEGGALATVQQASSSVIGSNLVWITGIETTSISIALTGGATPAPGTPYTRLYGYSSTRGDNGFATIQATASLGTNGILYTGNAWQIENIVFDANLQTNTPAININVSAANNMYYHDVMKNGTAGSLVALAGGGTQLIQDCEITGTTAGTAAVNFTGGNPRILHDWVHDNLVTAILSNAAAVVMDSTLANNSGATSDGINLSATSIIYGNTIYKCGRDAIRAANVQPQITIQKNIFANNGGFGMNDTFGLLPASENYDGNAYFSNTSGNRNNFDGLTGNLNTPAAYKNVNDVILAASPFVNPAGNDFRLNNTIGGGAACKNIAVPQTILNTTNFQNYADLGVMQAQREFSAGFSN